MRLRYFLMGLVVGVIVGAAGLGLAVFYVASQTAAHDARHAEAVEEWHILLPREMENPVKLIPLHPGPEDRHRWPIPRPEQHLAPHHE